MRRAAMLIPGDVRNQGIEASIKRADVIPVPAILREKLGPYKVFYATQSKLDSNPAAFHEVEGYHTFVQNHPHVFSPFFGSGVPYGRVTTLEM